MLPGLVLIASAAVAMMLANSSAAPFYTALIHMRAGPVDLHHAINDGLMALFFLGVGLEIKRELLRGRLADPRGRRLPVIAAIAGMAMPAAVYLAIAAARPELHHGWAVPAATDIAFAVGVLALLGPRAPAALALFLTTVAIVDDIGAVAIIALFYSSGLNLLALGMAAVVLLLMVWLNRRGVRSLPPFLILAVALWGAVLASGIHATVAGVLAAATIPLGRDDHSPLHRLEHGLHPWISYAILPLFGLVNAGVAIGGGTGDLTLPLAVGLGLFVGKQAGIFGAVWAADRLGIAYRPSGTSWVQVYGVALLCGIGFTMSLFIGGLAFVDPHLIDEVKLGVLGGSVASALAGFAVLWLAGGKGNEGTHT
ncbi:Na+/H+ antiporter NhaA [Sphingomonas sp. ID0503]|uniref:Na+/H+ antiporter NhaA n=1 Tax=Sphingomonas sp. ID0503 TaxID=3399691 RepID=UPI003AFA1D15